ncbi:PLC-like phosphodiesterase [Clavulina sp. PMI_390]|nr:PLC-like phosphodiesterase [Clavulina sp. PMI_390]
MRIFFLVFAESSALSSNIFCQYDIQGHRGGRGHTVENTLPSFAWGLINGVTTLELDNGITKDGHVIVWHDEEFVPTKCKDTGPVTPEDPLYPYVGKFVANLTLAQVKTLDCGSLRQPDYPRQILYPSTRVATLPEFFSFLNCADPKAQIKLNIESKIDPVSTNSTVGVSEFVERQHEVFRTAGAPWYNKYGAITLQSFDWRTLVGMKKKDQTDGHGNILLSALVDGVTAVTNSSWLADAELSSFPGPTLGEQIAQAAYSIGAHILSPDCIAQTSTTTNPNAEGFVEFTTEAMVNEAHKLGMAVKPWTVDDLELLKRLVLDYKVDGIISDEPRDVRRWAKYEADLLVGRTYPKKRVFECLKEHVQVDSTSYLKNL